ncbi:MAG: hypothetical protein U0987_15785 [Afipia sp.]|nr:hypothetical protein [Afipia sp.]
MPPEKAARGGYSIGERCGVNPRPLFRTSNERPFVAAISEKPAFSDLFQHVGTHPGQENAIAGDAH